MTGFYVFIADQDPVMDEVLSILTSEYNLTCHLDSDNIHVIKHGQNHQLLMPNAKCFF